MLTSRTQRYGTRTSRKKKNVDMNMSWFTMLQTGVKCFARTKLRKMEEFYCIHCELVSECISSSTWYPAELQCIRHTSINSILLTKCGTSFSTNKAMTKNVAPPCNKKSSRKWKPSTMSKMENPMVIAGKMRWRLVNGESPHWPGTQRTIMK
jgi:hypothetical protein